MDPITITASISHYVKARLRRTWKAREVKYERLLSGLERARHVVVFVVRDEGRRLPFFLQYYRNLGFEHFICVDNGSTDGTREQLSGCSDVSIVSSGGSYKAARFGNDWINAVINRHCLGKWILYVDADEFFVYPHCDTRPIGSLTSYLDSIGNQSLQTVMVDMYSRKPILENICEAGRDPLEVCNLFDRTGYASHFDKRTQTIWIKGGVRGRVYFQNRIWDGPALNKVPLVYMGGERMFLKSSHQVWPLSLNLGEMRGAVRISGALLHFKFLSTFVKKAIDPLNRAEHTEEYTAYTSNIDNTNFVSSHTTEYKTWEDLSEAGLMQGVGWIYWRNAIDRDVMPSQLSQSHPASISRRSSLENGRA